MSSFNFYLAVITGKVISFFLKVFGRGGTAAPGLYSQKIDPHILTQLAKYLKSSMVISGTNGKTTTTRLIATILKFNHINFIHNRAGSNLERGIISELITNYNFRNIPGNCLGLWETDEASFPIITQELKPKIVVLTNLFRDQLDRYGEIDTIAKKWKKALELLPLDSLVILNSDDPTVASLGKNLKCKVIYFGIQDDNLNCGDVSHASDATSCPRCLKPLKYHACFVSHMGRYYCSECGSIQPKPNLTASQIQHVNGKKLNLILQTNLKSFKASINLAGIYNVYNLLGAFSVGSSLNITPKNIISSFALFKPAFGRLETIKFRGKNLIIMLIKNPTGFNQVLKTLVNISQNQSASLLIALNDNIADGRDVSWIWDVDLENIVNMTFIKNLFISGTRAEDMALRIKYSGYDIQGSQFAMEKNLEQAVNKLLISQTKYLFILPTYTAMLEIRKILNKKGLVHNTWKD